MAAAPSGEDCARHGCGNGRQSSTASSHRFCPTILPPSPPSSLAFRCRCSRHRRNTVGCLFREAIAFRSCKMPWDKANGHLIFFYVPFQLIFRISEWQAGTGPCCDTHPTKMFSAYLYWRPWRARWHDFFRILDGETNGKLRLSETQMNRSMGRRSRYGINQLLTAKPQNAWTLSPILSSPDNHKWHHLSSLTGGTCQNPVLCVIFPTPHHLYQ